MNIDEITKLKNQLKDLEIINSRLKHNLSSFNQIFSRKNIISSRIKLCIILLKLCPIESYIAGSFIRLLFEFLFHIDSINNNDWISNPSQHTIHIILFKNVYDRTNCIQSYLSIIKLLEYTMLISKTVPQKRNMCKISNYLINGIKEKDIDGTPVSEICFKNYDDEFILKISPWGHSFISIDFSVNSFILNRTGIVHNNYGHDNNPHKFGFISFIENIQNKEIKYIQQIDKFQSCAFPPDGSVPYDVKNKYLQTFYSFININLLSLIESGYNLVGNYPSINIERKDNCPITGALPPYPVIKLMCNHIISLMAYKGIINNKVSDSSESIRCPYCRENLIVSFEITSETNEQFNGQKILDEYKKFHISKNKKIKHKYISAEAFDLI